MASKENSSSAQLKELDQLISEAEGLAAGSVATEEKRPDRAETNKSMSGLVGIVMAIGFGWFLPKWQVTKQEIQELSDKWGAVLSKHLPADLVDRLAGTGAGGVDVEMGALKVTWDILYPRVKSLPVESEPPKTSASSPQKHEPVVKSSPPGNQKDSDGDNMLIIGGQ